MPAEMVCAIACTPGDPQRVRPARPAHRGAVGRRTWPRASRPTTTTRRGRIKAPPGHHVPRRHATRRRRNGRQHDPLQDRRPHGRLLLERGHHRPSNPTDPLAVDLKMKTPWVPFPAVLLIGQVGLHGVADLDGRGRRRPTLKSKPVGTGPFIFEDYKPNEYFKAKKNPNYWIQPYPYLDEIEFRPIPDALNRRDALKTGAIDIMHTDNGEVDHRASATTTNFVQEEITTNAETGYTLLHVTQTLPDGTPSPLQDQRVRCALGHRLGPDRPSTRPSTRASSPSPTGRSRPAQWATWRTPATRRNRTWRRRRSSSPTTRPRTRGRSTSRCATTRTRRTSTIAQFQKQWWEEAGVDTVTIDQIDQGNYIVTRPARQLPGRSSGATTAASTSTTSTSGGTPPPPLAGR